MQFKAIVIALAAVGSAVANPIENAPNAPSAKQMQDQAFAFAKANVGSIPSAELVKAAADLKAQHAGWPYFHGPNWNAFPCCNQNWGFFDFYNAYCFQQGWPFDVWNNFCFNPVIINQCTGLLGCLL